MIQARFSDTESGLVYTATQIRTENTRAVAIFAKTVRPFTSALIPETVKRLLLSTSGTTTLSWQRMRVTRLITKRFTKSARKKLSASLLTPKRNTPCVILRSEALLKLPTGSGLSLLPWISKSLQGGWQGSISLPVSSSSFLLSCSKPSSRFCENWVFLQSEERLQNGDAPQLVEKVQRKLGFFTYRW